MQGAGIVGPGRVDGMARRLRVESAPKLDQAATDQHVAQNRRGRARTGHFHDGVAFEAATDALTPGFLEADRPGRVDGPAHVDRCGTVVQMRGAVPQVGSVGRQIVHIAAGFVGQHASAPAIACEQVIAHLRGEADGEIAAARVTPLHGKRVLRQRARRRADDVAHQFDRKAPLRRFKQVEIAKVCDLDPTLALLSHGDAIRIDDRAKPGRHHEVSRRQQGLGGLRHLGHSRRRFHVNPDLGAARIGDADHRIDDACVEQRIGEDKHPLAGPDREHTGEIVDRLKPGLGGRDFAPQPGR